LYAVTMKKKWSTCPKCASDRVGHLATVNDYSDAARRLSLPQPRTLAVASETAQGWLGESQKESLAAEVEAYVCTVCGYFEEYVKNPDNVVWDKLLGFRWVNAPSPG
jgi:hypothetical protein